MLDHAVEALRSGAWLEPARLRRFGLLLSIGYFASWGYLLSGPGRFDRMGRPLGVDFAMFYGVSSALLHGVRAGSLYSPEVLHQAIQEWTGGARYVLLYPPTALLLVAPLAKLPYMAALAAWTVAGLSAYLVSVQRVLRTPAAVAAALLFPAVYVCVSNGHNGLLLAGVLGAALLRLPAAPLTAGALLAVVAATKPHLAVLAPIALMASGRWRALASMALMLAGLMGAAALVFGADAWSAFAHSAILARLLLEREAVSYATLASAFSATRLLGGSNAIGYAVQAAAGLFAVAAVAWVWRASRPYELQVAVLLLAGGLATPYVYDYDLPSLGIGLALWSKAAMVRGWRHWEKTTLFAVWVAPLLSRPLALATKIGVVPLALFLGLTILLQRDASDRASSGTGGD